MDNEENKILKIVDEEGNMHEIQVLDIFNVNEYPNKDYILYRKNEELKDDEDEEVLLSIIEENEDNFSLISIEDELEFNTVQKLLFELLNDKGE